MSPFTFLLLYGIIKEKRILIYGNNNTRIS